MTSQLIDSLSTGPFGSGAGLTSTYWSYHRHLEGIVERSLRASGSQLDHDHVAVRMLRLSDLNALHGVLVAGQEVPDELQRSLASTHAASDDWIHRIGELTVVPSDGIGRELFRRMSEALERDGAVDCRLRLCKPDDEQIEIYSCAVGDLTELLGALASETLQGVQAVAFVDGPVDSAFIWETPATILLASSKKPDRALACDTLLHEALHQKLAAARLSSSVFRSGYVESEGQRVAVPWGDTGFRFFATGRAVAAFHVYVHLSLLHLRMLELADSTSGWNGVSESVIQSRLETRLARARYLSEALRAGHSRSEFGSDGPELLSWLDSALVELESQCAVHGVAVCFPEALFDAL